MCLAVPGKIVSLDENEQGMVIGKVSFGGVAKEVNLSLLEEAQAGDYVLVHAGVAISIIDESEAEETLRLLSELEDLTPTDNEIR